MKRIDHVLRDNAGTDWPQYFIFFDTETKSRKISKTDQELTLLFGVAEFVRRSPEGKFKVVDEIVFNTSDEFFRWGLKHTIKGRRTMWIAHNIGFDAQVLDLIGSFHAAKWKRVNTFLSQSIFLMKFRRDKRSAVLIDNMNIFHSSLESLGEMIGLPKLTMPISERINEDFIGYCRRDVEVMRQAWQIWYQFNRDNNTGNFAYTLAGQAFNAFRHSFLKKDIFIHTNKKALDLERQSYHGGRVECFYIGSAPKQHYWKLDVNSMYPYVMLRNKYPVRLRSMRTLNLKGKQKGLKNDVRRIVKLRLNTKVNCFPTLNEGHLLYPIGTFEADLAEPELELVKRVGAQGVTLAEAEYDVDYIFREYVTHFYNLRLKYRKESNRPFERISKLFLNSLYGKFGQYNDEWKRDEVYDDMGDGFHDVHDPRYGGLTNVRVIAGVAEIKSGRHESFNSFPAIASFVTSYARALLYKYISIAGFHHVYYSDTDSLIVDKIGHDRLKKYMDDTKLGYLKVEAEGDDLVIRGLKDYYFADKNTIKGVKIKSKEIAPGVFRQLRFRGFNGALRKGDMGRVIISVEEKRLKRRYDKGIVTASGWVLPVVLREGSRVPFEDHG